MIPIFFYRRDVYMQHSSSKIGWAKHLSQSALPKEVSLSSLPPLSICFDFPRISTSYWHNSRPNLERLHSLCLCERRVYHKKHSKQFPKSKKSFPFCKRWKSFLLERHIIMIVASIYVMFSSVVCFHERLDWCRCPTYERLWIVDTSSRDRYVVVVSSTYLFEKLLTKQIMLH